MLNMTEEEMTKFREAGRYIGRIMNEEGYFERNSQQLKGAKDATYYDTLDSMLMALNSGDIAEMMIYYKTGQYLCATNDNLELAYNSS